MNKKMMFGMTGILVTACLVVLLTGKPIQSQDEPVAAVGKNMTIFTGDKAFQSPRELQTYMKSLTEALGVQCSYCHNMRDFTSDENPHKAKARQMMTMTSEINEKYFKDHPNEQMTCFACHQGREHPIFSKQQLMDIQAKEEN